MDLAGKVAIVTGASRGIGRQVAYELARRGAKVVVAARTVEPRANIEGTIGETLGAIEREGGTALAVRADMRVSEDLDRLVAAAVDAFGRLDVLVNNAADTRFSAPVAEHDWEAWRKQFDANVHAPFILTALAVPHMRAQGGGVVVNITSGAADMVDAPVGGGGAGGASAIGSASLLAYATTKAALNRLTNALAHELAPDNIAVVAVDPGFTHTELLDVMARAGQVDPAGAHPMSVPVSLVVEIITADDPLDRSGQVLRASGGPAD